MLSFVNNLFGNCCCHAQQYAPWFSFAPTIYYRPPGFTPNNYAPDGTLLFSSFEVRTVFTAFPIDLYTIAALGCLSFDVCD